MSLATAITNEKVCGVAVNAPAQEWVAELVHELRQPLSAIETIAFYLEMRSSEDQIQTRQWARRLQELVEDANDKMAAALTR